MRWKSEEKKGWEVGDGNMKEQEDQVGKVVEGENNERDILIEGAMMRLRSNLVLEKFSGIHNDDLT